MRWGIGKERKGGGEYKEIEKESKGVFERKKEKEKKKNLVEIIRVRTHRTGHGREEEEEIFHMIRLGKEDVKNEAGIFMYHHEFDF